MYNNLLDLILKLLTFITYKSHFESSILTALNSFFFSQDILILCSKWKNLCFFKKNCKSLHVCRNIWKFYLQISPSQSWRLKLLYERSLVILLNFERQKLTNISSFNLNAQSLIKWKKKIIQQVLRSRCKEKISVSKIIVDQVTKKIL